MSTVRFNTLLLPSILEFFSFHRCVKYILLSLSSMGSQCTCTCSVELNRTMQLLLMYYYMCFSLRKKESEFSNKVKVAVESVEIQARSQIHTVMCNVTIVQVVIEDDFCVTMLKRYLLSMSLCSVHINTPTK